MSTIRIIEDDYSKSILESGRLFGTNFGAFCARTNKGPSFFRVNFHIIKNPITSLSIFDNIPESG